MILWKFETLDSLKMTPFADFLMLKRHSRFQGQNSNHDLPAHRYHLLYGSAPNSRKSARYFQVSDYKQKKWCNADFLVEIWIYTGHVEFKSTAGVRLKFSGGGGGDTVKTPPSTNNFCLSLHYFEMFLERFLNDPPPSHLKPYQDFTLYFDCTIIVTSQMLMTLHF